MTHRTTVILKGTRIVYALFWVVLAVSPLFGAPYPRQPTQAADDFWDALMATGFIVPMTAATYLAGGVLCLLHRTTPLGLALLSPPLAIIVPFNVLLARLPGPWIAIVLVQLALMFAYREAYVPLWSYGKTRPGEFVTAQG